MHAFQVKASKFLMYIQHRWCSPVTADLNRVCTQQCKHVERMCCLELKPHGLRIQQQLIDWHLVLYVLSSNAHESSPYLLHPISGEIDAQARLWKLWGDFFSWAFHRPVSISSPCISMWLSEHIGDLYLDAWMLTHRSRTDYLELSPLHLPYRQRFSFSGLHCRYKSSTSGNGGVR